MGSYSTADEVKKEHIEKLGNDLGFIFHELWNEVASLYMKWEEYVELFGKAPSRIDLLNQAAPVFFKIVQTHCGKMFFCTSRVSRILRNPLVKRISL